MLQWLMWLRGERAAAKHASEQVPEAAKPQERRATKEAVRDAKEQWQNTRRRAVVAPRIATLAADLSSASVKLRPSASSQSRTL